MQACRDVLNGIRLQDGRHAGLLLSRFLEVTVKDKKNHPDSRKKLQQAAVAAVHASRLLYKRAFDRWQNSLPDPCEKQELRVQGRLIVGLGGENVLETGITLHHTYGVPIVPGSALKGLAAHYAAQVWGAADPKWKKHGEHHVTVFGAQDDAGYMVFHDAWIVPDSLANPDEGLVQDVMTPHHRDYYAKKKYEDGPKQGQLIPPTDFDDPNPVTFLSVAGRFLVAVSCDTPGSEGEKWAALTFDLLQEALREWGVGGKTSAGYGRFVTAADAAAVRSQDAGPSQTLADATRPRHQRGDRITVTRVEETTGKGKSKFRADDGFLGHFAGEEPPQIGIGETVEVWVANVNPQGYTLTLKQPRSKKRKKRP